MDALMNYRVVIKEYQVTIREQPSIMKYNIYNKGFNTDN